jgi:hypothetical protein
MLAHTDLVPRFPPGAPLPPASAHDPRLRVPAPAHIASVDPKSYLRMGGSRGASHALAASGNNRFQLCALNLAA